MNCANESIDKQIIVITYLPLIVPLEECNLFGLQCVTLMRPNELSFLISTENICMRILIY